MYANRIKNVVKRLLVGGGLEQRNLASILVNVFNDSPCISSGPDVPGMISLK